MWWCAQVSSQLRCSSLESPSRLKDIYDSSQAMPSWILKPAAIDSQKSFYKKHKRCYALCSLLCLPDHKRPTVTFFDTGTALQELVSDLLMISSRWDTLLQCWGTINWVYILMEQCKASTKQASTCMPRIVSSAHIFIILGSPFFHILRDLLWMSSSTCLFHTKVSCVQICKQRANVKY